jgi:hypothetical protein
MAIRCTVDGVSRVAVSWSLRVPYLREWQAFVSVETAGELPSAGAAVDLADDNGSAWRGTARRVTRLGATDRLDVVAGVGALSALTAPRFWGAAVGSADVLAALCSPLGEAAGTSGPLLPGWRSRGLRLRDELDQLARYSTHVWRTEPDGTIAIEPTVPNAVAPGELIDAAFDFRTYESDGLAPLVGGTLDGWSIATVLYRYDDSGRPTVTVWPLVDDRRGALRPLRAAVVSATVKATASGRVDVTTDDGTALQNVPLWSCAGIVPTVAAGSRVLVADLGDDPRSTFAFAGSSDSTAELVDASGGMGDEVMPALQATGRVVRYGDTIIVPSGAAGTPTPQVVQAAIIPVQPVPVSRLKG